MKCVQKVFFKGKFMRAQSFHCVRTSNNLCAHVHAHSLK